MALASTAQPFQGLRTVEVRLKTCKSRTFFNFIGRTAQRSSYLKADLSEEILFAAGHELFLTYGPIEDQAR
jgi:hypothetical protein